MSRFHDQTSAWFNQGEDAALLTATPGGEPEPRRPVGRIVATSAITLAVALLAVFLLHRSSRAAAQNKSPSVSASALASAPVTNPAPAITPVLQIAPSAAPAITPPAPAIAPPPAAPAAAPKPAPRARRRVAKRAAAAATPSDNLRQFQDRLAKSPDDEAALRGACLALVQLGRVSDAARLCRHALRVDPTDVTARRALARSYALGGACQWALNEWRQILADRPGDPEARRELHARRATCD